MLVPRYWVKESAEEIGPGGRRLKAEAWGWSANSNDEARDLAKQRAKRSVQRLSRGDKADWSYGYGSVPQREQILQEISAPIPAIITRSAYGSTVLNVADVMFVDVDFPKSAGGLRSVLAGLIGRKASSAIDRSLETLNTWHRRNPSWSFRIYETYGGLRYLATNARHMASDNSAISIMTELGADPLYVKLCKIQECFRARVSPKPWRCQISSPPVRYPFSDSTSHAQFAEWLVSYENVEKQYATCRFLSAVGSNYDRSIATLVELHDRLTRANSTLPLA